jgi:hypothetical protein
MDSFNYIIILINFKIKNNSENILLILNFIIIMKIYKILIMILKKDI